MAQARARGGSGTAAAIGVLAGGFLLCLVLAVVFYVQWTGEQESADQARADLAVYVDNVLENDDRVQALRQEADPVVGSLLTELRDVWALVGLEEGQLSALRAELDEHGRDGRTMLGMIEDLLGRESELEGQIAQLEQGNANLRTSMGELEDWIDELMDEHEQTVAGLESELEDVEQQVGNYRDQIASLEDELRAAGQERASESGEQIAGLQEQVDTLEAERDDLEARIRELMRRDDIIGPPELARADGEVLAVREEGTRVYLNLGANDRIVHGMTFEVFGADELIRHEDPFEFRGIATVEVVRVEDNRSVARVVRRQRGMELAVGDQLINLVYHPQITYRFYVHGDFAIADGTPTREDRHRIESIIRRWGGEVVDELDYDVDFVVMGQRPRHPDERPGDALSAREAEVAAAQHQQYQQVVQEARELTVPILNQHRFLALVGYYERR